MGQKSNKVLCSHHVERERENEREIRKRGRDVKIGRDREGKND